MTTIHDALAQFEATESNIVKLEQLCADIRRLIPGGIVFGSDGDYDDKIRAATDLAAHLPAIDGWRPDLSFVDYNTIAQMRLDLLELGEPSVEMQFESSLDGPQLQVREYRYRFNKMRRALVWDSIEASINEFDQVIREAKPLIEQAARKEDLPDKHLKVLRTNFRELHTLLGGGARPSRWSDLSRHLSFGLIGDFSDIVSFDWPAVKADIRKDLYAEDEAIPVSVADLGELVASKPSGPIPTRLNWAVLDEDGFERLIFSLISKEPGYENPEWLTQTKARDRGRDLSVTRVARDRLAGTLRSRVIIQCKHWQSQSVSLKDVTAIVAQMDLWAPPQVDVLIIATSGRFTTDAIDWIERHNQSGRAPRVEMWADSHLEMVLAERPALIGQFQLR